MSTRRFSLAILAGVAMLPIALQKSQEILAPYLSNARLMQIHKTPIPIQNVNFMDSSGRQLSFSDFRGKHVLVNVWATWCSPCRQEMPALDRLKEKLGPKAEPEIVAISVDAVSFDQLQAFYIANGINKMAIYRGNEAEVLEALKVGGLPTTLLVNHDGQEIARLVGPTAWDNPEVMKQLFTLVADSITEQGMS